MLHTKFRYFFTLAFIHRNIIKISLCILFSSSLAAQSIENNRKQEVSLTNELRAKVAVSLSLFRSEQLSYKNNVETISNHADHWLDKYKKRIPAAVRTMVWTDFFSSALILVGKQTPEEGIGFLYNPFSDVVLLVKTDNTLPQPQIENFCFLPGNVLRGEKLEYNKYPPTMFPDKQSFFVAFLNAVSSIETAVGKIDNPVESFKGYQALENKAASLVERNLLARYSFALKLNDKKYAVQRKQCSEIGLALQSTNKSKLMSMAKNEHVVKIIESYEQIPSNLRSGMSLFSWLPSKNGTTFIFANKLSPRFIVIVFINKQNKIGIELLDLGNSSKLLEIYNKHQRKDVEK